MMPSPELVDGDGGAERQADHAADQHRRHADAQAQQDDVDERRVGGGDQPEGLCEGLRQVVQGRFGDRCGPE